MTRTHSIPLLGIVLAFVLGCGGKGQPTDGKPVAGIPTDKGEMFAFLKGGEYKSWDAESAVHKSSGPHGTVRTYVNAALVGSLSAQNAEHPVGSAAVKEFYGDDGATVTGWAIMLKASAGAAKESWYWYEVFSTTDGSSPIEGLGHTTCTGCHSKGADYVRVPFPLN